MKLVNEQPILAKRLGEEVIFEQYPGEKYVFVHVKEGGAYVFSKDIVYTRKDGRYGVNYNVLQEVGCVLGQGDTVSQVVAQLDARPTTSFEELKKKFQEYGIKIKDVSETRHKDILVENIETERGKKVSVRNNTGELFGPYQAKPDTDMVIIENEGDYYFLPKVCEGSGKKKPGQFYLSERIHKYIGPNRWEMLEYLVSDEKEREINNYYYENVKKRGRGRLPDESKPEKKTRNLHAAAEKKSKEVTNKILESAQTAMEDFMTNPFFSVKRTTLDLGNMDATFSREGIEIEKNGGKVVLSSEDLEKINKTYEQIRQYYG